MMQTRTYAERQRAQREQLEARIELFKDDPPNETAQHYSWRTERLAELKNELSKLGAAAPD